MGRNKTPGTVLGLVGCAGAAWGMHALARSTTCTGDNPVGCPPDWLVLVLVAGIVLAILASFFGRGALIFVGLLAGVGGGALVGGLQAGGEGGGVMVLLGAIFLGVVLLPVLFLPFLIRKRRRAQRLLESGGQAIGTVISFRDTGVTVNRDPRIELTLRIEPTDGSPPFEGRKTAVISRLTPPYAGQRYPVWYDRDDPTTFMLGADLTDEAAPDVLRLFERAAAQDLGRPGATAQVPAGAEPDTLTRLERLNDLRQSGALTDEEFNQQKAKLLGSG